MITKSICLNHNGKVKGKKKDVLSKQTALSKAISKQSYTGELRQVDNHDVINLNYI